MWTETDTAQFRNYPGIYLEGLGGTTKPLSQDSVPLAGIKPPQTTYQSKALSFESSCPVQFFWFFSYGQSLLPMSALKNFASKKNLGLLYPLPKYNLILHRH
jgi:hypothetical protein